MRRKLDIRNVRWSLLLAVMVLLAAGCSVDPGRDTAADEAETGSGTADGEPAAEPSSEDTSAEGNNDDGDPSAPRDYGVERFGPAPSVPEGALSGEAEAAISRLSTAILAGDDSSLSADVQLLGQSDDPRVAWVLSDLLRFSQGRELGAVATIAANQVLGTSLVDTTAWGDLTDHLIGWDIPAPPGYLDFKRSLYSTVLPAWQPFFEEGRDVDWRLVSWGGVGIDDRPFDQTDRGCNCIPAADNPAVTDADGGDWYPDDGVVFGVEIDGEARAYPRNIMEIREMVNDTLGGRDFAMPYCTLCGSAQVYFTDTVPSSVERPVLRTSGLLVRSNKVMFDVETFSVFDTFTGEAKTGPLADEGIVLPQHSVVTTTWGQWKQEHPDTTILDESLALGRDSDLRNTRDADGPIFPIGGVDPRLGVQDDVVGVIDSSGQAIAFPVVAAAAALEAGEQVVFDGIEIVAEGGGYTAIDRDGNDIASHQAFWFAWSQFHPDTELWERS